jgi:hypothetical protein
LTYGNTAGQDFWRVTDEGTTTKLRVVMIGSMFAGALSKLKSDISGAEAVEKPCSEFSHSLREIG